MSTSPDISPNGKNRRRFLSNGLKLGGASILLLPLQKAFGSSGPVLAGMADKTLGVTPAYQLILNKKTKVVHLLAGELFVLDRPVEKKNIELIDITKWETKLKPPVHLDKYRSGIILEILALHKLTTGLTAVNLTAAISTLSMAFSPVYKEDKGEYVNKNNFRLHDLLQQLIVLNPGIPTATQWKTFQTATGNINYSIKHVKGKELPERVNWIKTKEAFEKKANHIRENKTDYTNRLKKRVEQNKLLSGWR